MIGDRYCMLPLNLRTNISEIDIEHNDLFFSLEGFKEYCFDSEPVPQDKRDALHQLLFKHFETEANLAQLSQVDFSAHEAAHLRMLNVVTHSLNQMSSKNSDLYSLIRYISYWFEKHIFNFDLPLAQQIIATR